MDFKVPALPAGFNKRKFSDLPPPEVLKRFKPDDSPSMPPPPVPSSSGSRNKQARVEDEDDDIEREDPYDFAPGGDADYFAEEDEDGRFFGGGLNNDQKVILDMFDEAGDGSGEQAAVTLPTLRKQLMKFERTVKKNQEMRVKFPDDPEKFIDSEGDLDSALKALLTLTQNPAMFYPEFIKSGTTSLLAELMSHENTDIALDVVEVVQELTDEDVGAEANDENEEETHLSDGNGAKQAVGDLIEALLEHNFFELLVANLRRLSEEEESDRQGVFHTLGIFENFLSFDPSLAERLVNETDALQWLLKRVTVPAYDSNKQYTSEIISILLQQSRPNRLKLIKLDAIDTFLNVLSQYRKRDPSDAEEVEFMENIFDSLCSSLAESEVKKVFKECEGADLMVLLMKAKMLARSRAIKVLDYALSGPEGADNCTDFILNSGLKSLFSAFMGRLSASKKSLKALNVPLSTTEDVDHILGILVSLFTNLPSDSDDRLRLLVKFVEDDYEKVDRLLEIRESAELRLQVVEKEIDEERKILEDDIDDVDEEGWYLRRLEAGLHTLQMVDYILSWVIMEDDGARDQALLLLKRKDRTVMNLIQVLSEQHGSIEVSEDDEGGADGGEQDPTPGEIQRGILEGLMTYLYGLL